MPNVGFIHLDLAERLAENSEVRNALRQHLIVKRSETQKVVDSPYVYDIGGLFIVLVSPLLFPNVGADEGRAIKSVGELLPSHVSTFTIEIVAEGRLNDGRSFVVMPKGKGLSKNRIIFAMQKRRIEPVILKWIRALAVEATGPSDRSSAEFQASLESLLAIRSLPAEIATSARDGLARLSKGLFVPRHCPMHGDLWKGNIIYGPDNSIKVIDWRGYRMDGYGIFDLVKFCQSFNVNKDRFRGEMKFHAYSLGIDEIDVRTTFLAGCGYISRSLGEFPLASFVAMTSSLFSFLKASLESNPELVDQP